MSLFDENARLHERLNARWMQMMIHLTALDVEAAEIIWLDMKEAIQRHLAYEEDVMLGVFDSVGAGAPNTNKLVHGDHVILQRSEAAIGDAFQTLKGVTDDETRRQMVLLLDVFLRWARVWEHHTDREQRTFYAVLDDALDRERAEHYATQLREATVGAAGSAG